MKYLRILLPAVLVLGEVSHIVAQNWTASNSGLWCNAVACSADGNKLVVAGTGIYTSTNAGATWTLTSAPTDQRWFSVASSADGTTLIAVVFCGLIYASTNSGATWTLASAPSRCWTSVACSADGTKLAAANAYSWQQGNGLIYTSADFGQTWLPTSAPNYYSWHSVASSADGNRLVAVGDFGPVFTSTNTGSTWTAMNTPTNSFHTSVASSADGARLATAFDGETFDGYTNYLYTSTNSGVSWSPSVFILDWAKSQSSLALSADGNTLLASVNGYVMVSTNGGIPWSSTCLTGACGGDTNPIAVASSADGHKLFAGFYGDIYTLQTKPSPVLNIAASDENLILSWVVPSMNFVLQENSDVTTTNWTDVTVGPTLNYTNLQYEVIVPTPRPRTMFYRLASR